MKDLIEVASEVVTETVETVVIEEDTEEAEIITTEEIMEVNEVNDLEDASIAVNKAITPKIAQSV